MNSLPWGRSGEGMSNVFEWVSPSHRRLQVIPTQGHFDGKHVIFTSNCQNPDLRLKNTPPNDHLLCQKNTPKNKYLLSLTRDLSSTTYTFMEGEKT